MGETIPDQIIQSVESSRRTLIVLSKAYVDSMWTKLEFRAAHTQVDKLVFVWLLLGFVSDSVFVNSSNCISWHCPHAGPARQDAEGDLGGAGQGRDCGQGQHGGRPAEIHLPQHIPWLWGSLVLAKAQVCDMFFFFVLYMFLLQVALIWCWKNGCKILPNLYFNSQMLREINLHLLIEYWSNQRM